MLSAPRTGRPRQRVNRGGRRRFNRGPHGPRSGDPVGGAAEQADRAVGHLGRGLAQRLLQHARAVLQRFRGLEQRADLDAALDAEQPGWRVGCTPDQPALTTRNTRLETRQ